MGYKKTFKAGDLDWLWLQLNSQVECRFLDPLNETSVPILHAMNVSCAGDCVVLLGSGLNASTPLRLLHSPRCEREAVKHLFHGLYPPKLEPLWAWGDEVKMTPEEQEAIRKIDAAIYGLDPPSWNDES